MMYEYVLWYVVKYYVLYVIYMVCGIVCFRETDIGPHRGTWTPGRRTVVRGLGMMRQFRVGLVDRLIKFRCLI